MYALIERFPRQLQEAIEIGERSNITQTHKDIRNIVISGMGGSGIGGRLVKDVAGDSLKVPVVLNNGYFSPAFVNEHSLVIISSYSGNTEETLTVMDEALKQRALVKCITSNGRVQQMAEDHGLQYIQIPGGDPPRACLGYSFVQQLYLLHKSGFIDETFKIDLIRTANQLKESQQGLRVEAKKIAEKLKDTAVIIYSEDAIESVSLRFKQQINENSKMHAWHNVFPELNHNELVGWRTKGQPFSVVLLRHGNEFERNSSRIAISKEVMEKYAKEVVEIEARGESKLEQMLYLIHLTDWVSYYLAEIQGMDPMEIKVIDHLKNELAKL